MAVSRDDDIIDYNAIRPWFSVPIFWIFAWLVPSIINSVRLFRRTIERTHQKWRPEIPRELKHHVVTHNLAIGLVVSCVFFICSTLAVALPTNKIDDRSSYIIEGGAYLVASIFIFLISYHIPKWMGVYYTMKDQRRTHLGNSLKSLGFYVQMAIYRDFCKVFFFMVPSFCGAKPGTIPVSVVTGTVAGLVLALAIDFMNRKLGLEQSQLKYKAYVAVFLAFVFIFISAIEFAWGVRYIEITWENSTEDYDITTLFLVAFFCWIIGAIIFHLVAYTVMAFSSAKSNESSIPGSEGADPSSPVASLRPTTFFGESMYISKRDIGDLKPNNEQQAKSSGSLGAIEEGSSAEKEDETSTVAETEAEQAAPINTQSSSNSNNSNNSSIQEETYSELVKSHCGFCCGCCSCCGCCGGSSTKDDAPSWQENTLTVIGWISYVVTALAVIFFVVVMAGAQVQEAEVRHYLPLVYDYVYKDLNTGPVCAYDANYGVNLTTEAQMDATQTNFSSPEAAHAANFSILHCGECGACSNFNDLRIEYTTRNSLGQTALQCAIKSLTGGGYEALKNCTMENTGFEDDCASCWTTDYICTRNNCIFISLKAFIIGSVSNLAVGPDDITPATCEEAFCEATEITGYVGFVPCSGATRRRMNITSSIARSHGEQCQNVDVLPWDEFFGYSSGYGDICPVPNSEEPPFTPASECLSTTPAQ